MIFLQLPDNEKFEFFNQLHEDTNLPQVIIEKDVWVTAVLRAFVKHRRMFIAMKGFDYDTLTFSTLKIVPPEKVMAKWEDDYNKMQAMIYGKILSFSEIIYKIRQLNERINSNATD
jgi:hypothetical protein